MFVVAVLVVVGCSAAQLASALSDEAVVALFPTHQPGTLQIHFFGGTSVPPWRVLYRSWCLSLMC